MILIAIMLGFLAQLVFPGFIQPALPRFWQVYLEPFSSWEWFRLRSFVWQAVLVLFPLFFGYWVLWHFFSDVLWSMGHLLIFLVGFLLSCVGYLRLEGLHIFASHLAHQPDLARAREFLATHYSVEQESQPAAFRHQAFLLMLDTVALELFCALFWFVWLGPLGSLLLTLLLVVSRSDDLPNVLRGRAIVAIHWLCWLPVRLLAVSLFYVLRQQPTPLAVLWGHINGWDMASRECLAAAVGLAWERPLDQTAGSMLVLDWSDEDFEHIARAFKRVLLLWLMLITVLIVLI